ncbi:hypothetical protein D9M68_718290 [compost metagenome]
MVGGNAQLVRELVEVRGQHQVAFRVAQHQHQAEHFQAQEEQQHGGVQHGRAHHRQADRHHHAQRRGAGHAGGFLHVRTHAAQRRRDVQVGVRHVRQAGDDDDAGQRIDVPGHEAQQVLHPGREKADGAGGHHVAEAQHHGRHEHGHQDQRLDPAAAGQVRADHQEGQHAAQRDGDDGQAEGEDEAALQGLVEIGVRENEAECVQAEDLGRGKERRGEKALDDDERQRHVNRQGRDQHHHAAGQGLPFSAQ